MKALTSALSRFDGPEGERRLIEAFDRVRIGDKEGVAATKLAKASVCCSYDKGALIIEQDANDNDFYLVLVGSVDVERNGRADRIRPAGTYFGEMTLIDVNARRSASVRARETTIVARVSESDFSRVALEHPELWRCLAVEIARRLRERLSDHPPRNSRPRVFIGSSSEAQNVAGAIAKEIGGDAIEVALWSGDVFTPSNTTIEDLEIEVRRSDFAVLVLSDDDRLHIRHKAFAAPRDNVVFELGLFMGALGRERVFIVCPYAPKSHSMMSRLREVISAPLALRLPTDLLGVTVLRYDNSASDKFEDAVSSVCKQVKQRVDERGAK